MSTLIKASNLYKRFGGSNSPQTVSAVDGISLQVSAGEVFGLIGPDGAGKTTTIRLLCGGLAPTYPRQRDLPGPEIIIAGQDLLKHPEQARSQIGYLSQRFALYEDLTVLENIRFFAEQRGLKAAAWRPRCMEILEFVGLADYKDRRAAHLSGGMKQKLGLAAALVHQPKVLLLDEPTTGVDPVTRQDFWQLIIRLVAQNHTEGTAVLVSTPYMDEAARCTRIGFMQQGRFVAEGTPAELRASLAGRVLELTGSPLFELRKEMEKDPDVEFVHMFGDRLNLRVRPGQAETVINRLTASESSLPAKGFHLSRIRLIQPGLEDVFMYLLGTPTPVKEISHEH